MRSLFSSISAGLILFCALLAPRPCTAQTAHGLDSTTVKASVDTTLPHAVQTSGIWRRPEVQRDGSTLFYSGEAMRYYGSPITIPLLLEESGGPYPLILGEEGYGRESFLATSRSSEGLISSMINTVLPMASTINGEPLFNYFPMTAFEDVRLNAGAAGQSAIHGDYAASDAVDLSIERFRAPVPYSRVHYTQELGRSSSVFDGLFSINASPSTNLAFAVYRRATGHAPAEFDPTLNPRTDLWSGRGQMSISKYLGDLPRDSALTRRRIDSLLALPAAREKTFDLLLWSQYVTAFSGLSGGLVIQDSVNPFDPRLASVLDPNTFDHRVRIDGLLDIQMPLLAEARTRLSGFGTYESRRILSRDTTFPSYVPDVVTGRRYGVTLSQPLTFTPGNFLLRAVAQGDLQRVERDPSFVLGQSLSDTRLFASISGTVEFHTAFRFALNGFFRTGQSSLKVGDTPVQTAVFPVTGFAGTIGFTDALSFTASYYYASDRASLSPTPEATYILRNIGGFLDMRFPLSRRDSVAIHAGILERNEPEGIVYNDSLIPRFSNAPKESQYASIDLDAYISHLHFASSVNYLPAAPNTSLQQRFFGYAGLYYENELAEGNLRLSIGTRLRFLNRLDPAMSYDRAADYYVYTGSVAADSLLLPEYRSVMQSPKGLLDILLAMEVDRRAQVNMSFLNLLGTPFYNVNLYPRPQFHWRIDVTWAFLD